MCGIFAIYSNHYSENNFKKLFKCMKLLQHRGKDGYGISYLDYNDSFNIIKEKGMIVNSEPPLRVTKSCIGHLRYSTSGNSIDSLKIDIMTSLCDIHKFTNNHEIYMISNIVDFIVEDMKKKIYT